LLIVLATGGAQGKIGAAGRDSQRAIGGNGQTRGRRMDDAVDGVKMAQLRVFAAVEAVIAIVEPNGPSRLPVRVVIRD
jgi:hypothetical protein